MALGSSVVPEEVRGSGLALLRTATNIARLLASLAFGALWTSGGHRPAIACFGVGARGGDARWPRCCSLRTPEPAHG